MPASARRAAGFLTNVEHKRPVFQVDFFKHSQLQGQIVFGQSSPDARCTVDGHAIDFDNIPLKKPLVIEEAWFSFKTSWFHSSIDNQTICAHQLTLHSMNAQSRSGVIASLDYRSLAVDADDSDEVTLAGG
jgi:hypothetical protein